MNAADLIPLIPAPSTLLRAGFSTIAPALFYLVHPCSCPSREKEPMLA